MSGKNRFKFKIPFVAEGEAEGLFASGALTPDPAPRQRPARANAV
jgi:hypothetical protein